MAWQLGLCGVFLWEAGQDLSPTSKASLLRTLNQERRRLIAKSQKGLKTSSGKRVLQQAAARGANKSKRQVKNKGPKSFESVPQKTEEL